jgi:hypothetical protein
MAVLLTETGEITVDATDGLWVSAADAERATGWSLKPEGMCREALCVPLPADALRAGRVDLAAFWRRLDNVVLSDDEGEIWVLGAGADARNQALAGLIAPDFALPDLDGTPHRLSELRGRKVFLASWASW